VGKAAEKERRSWRRSGTFLHRDGTGGMQVSRQSTKTLLDAKKGRGRGGMKKSGASKSDEKGEAPGDPLWGKVVEALGEKKKQRAAQGKEERHSKQGHRKAKTEGDEKRRDSRTAQESQVGVYGL